MQVFPPVIVKLGTSLCPLGLVFLQLQIFGFEEIEKHS